MQSEFESPEKVSQQLANAKKKGGEAKTEVQHIVKVVKENEAKKEQKDSKESKDKAEAEAIKKM
jgi:hypothetical protein